MKLSGNSNGDESHSTQEEIWLLGQPPLRRYLGFVEEMAVGGDVADRSALVDEWRKANDYYHELEESEAGIANQVECRDLDPALAALAEEIKGDARYRHTFDSVPTQFGMVELDRLVVFQTRVVRPFVDDLTSRLGPAPSPETLFRFCLPPVHPEAPVRIRRVGSQRYVFSSESSDFRFHEPVLLGPEQVRDYHSFGPIAGIVGLVVGFGSNLLNVIRADDRLLLHNGYHRACALRALGITHAPCIIQTVTRRDELDIVAKREIADDPAFYFKAARPPLLKDFFDPKIRKVLRVHRRVKMIEVNFEVRDFIVLE
jgi:hypothetical protein